MRKSRFDIGMCVGFSVCRCVGCMYARRSCRSRCFAGMWMANTYERSLLLFLGLCHEIPLYLVRSSSRYIYIYIHIYDSVATSVRTSGARRRKSSIQRPCSRGIGLLALHVLGVLPDLVPFSRAPKDRDTIFADGTKLFF